MRRLRISDNRRFLVWEDGEPFFWLADTAWELLHRLSYEEAQLYFVNRRQKGFTVVQTVALAELDGLNSPNREGERPLIENDPLRPKESYFLYVDRILALAADHQLVVALLPTWGDKVELMAHGVGPVIFNPTNAFAYGQWLGRRYRDQWNLVWINGGDRQGGGQNQPIWDALARGIKSADPNHLMSFHPPGGRGGRSSSEWFHAMDWLDFNLAQSGHERKHLPNHEIVSRDYQLSPTKPCLDGEPRYEDHGVNWKPLELGWFDDYDVRQAAYWAVLAGALGHTYGCHPVWQFLTADRQPIGLARRDWRDALDLPGAGQMQHLRQLIESRSMFSRKPDQTVLVEPKAEAQHLQACRGDDYILFYLPQGGTVMTNLASFRARAVQAWWFDPRTGRARNAGLFPHADQLQFTAPWAGPCADWVLVLDDAAARYSLPGQTRAT
jgi:hypothetical protein